MTIEKIIEKLKELPSDFSLSFIYQEKVSKEELATRTYKFPFDFTQCNAEIGDIGYSDKEVQILLTEVK
jgi:hypothetical protein